jgi:DNA-binding CsgD family transcriptional regulator
MDSKHAPTALERRPLDAETGQALRSLIECVLLRHIDDPDRQILLDIEVEGVRCTLTRNIPVPSFNLSPREQDIVTLVVDGKQNKEIARTLQISTHTVDTHLRRVFLRLGVKTRAAMVAKLMELGTIEGHQPTSCAYRPHTRTIDGVEMGVP